MSKTFKASKKEIEEFERDLRSGKFDHKNDELAMEEMRKNHRDQFGLDGAFDADEYIIKLQSIKPHGIEVRGDGGRTHYYDIPKGATQLRHLIKHKKMEHGIGEAFCALYRLNDNGEYERNLRKVYDYIVAELEYLSNSGK